MRIRSRKYGLNEEVSAGVGCFLILAALAIFAGAVYLSVWLFHFAWMNFAVAVFKLPAINMWQAWAAIILLGFIGRVFTIKVKKDED